MITKSTSCSFGAAYEPIQSLRSRQNISARLLIKPYTEKSPLSSVRQRPEHARSVRVTAESSQTAEASSDNAPSTSASAPDKYSSGVPDSDVWELDFSSRPVLDDRGKKRWELLICSVDGSWRYSRYFPSNKINSTQLRIALVEILDQKGAREPRRVKFFRGQMQTIISRALTDLGITPVPSRRCFFLIRWLEDRLETVYKKDPRYSDKASSLFMLDLGSPEKLPDALRGEKWSFVQLPLSALQQELQLVEQGSIFGDGLPLAAAGASDLEPDTLVPGVAIYSVRAKPLAAWTRGFDLANLVADPDRACLVLETGVNQRWRYCSFRRTPENIEEAEAWEDAKKGCRGLHFLAIQKDEEADECNGLWLLMDKPLPSF